MKAIDKTQEKRSGLKIQQKRSKKTYDALIKTGFKLLQKQKWDSITVAELSKAAGYSVGAFYARFHSKDEFFEALVAHQGKTRATSLERFFSSHDDDEFVDELIINIVHYHWKNRNYWLATLLHGMRNPDFWTPIRQGGHEVASKTISKLSGQANCPLTDLEEINVRFAFQILFGTVNNSIINRPGPIFMNQHLFTEKLIRAFRLISDYDRFKTKAPL